jgi:dihydrofolate synthase/folylpolyglutamate synthase
LAAVRWPARLQPLAPGPLRDLLPRHATLWLDGAHNPTAAAAVADHCRRALATGQPLHLITGLLANKDPDGVLAPFAGLALSLTAVPVPDHDHHAPATLATKAAALGLAAHAAPDVDTALRRLASRLTPDSQPLVLIMGSLYLAGVVLDANRQWPD